MKNVYLVLAIVGGILPYVFFIDFFSSEGIELTTFVGGLFANGASAGFVVDLLISSLVFWLMMSAQDEPKPWIYILINLSIGLSCALPLYLYLRKSEDSGAH